MIACPSRGKLEPLRIAFLPFIRNTFDVPFAEQMISEAREALVKAGFHLLGPEQPIHDLSEAKATISNLSRIEMDLVLVFQATFSDSTMVVEFAQEIDAPLFLWAVPEPWTGERLRLNSLCGINLAGHALTLRKFHYDYAYAMPKEAEVMEKIRNLATASFLRRRLKTSRLGVVGDHPVGMDTCNLEEARLREVFGIQIQKVELDDVFKRARSISGSTIGQTRTLLDTRLDNLSSLDQVPLNGTLSVYSALKEIAVEYTLDGLAVRCWPEFFTEMGCAACGAMSMLSDGMGLSSPLPCSCEADINGTLTQLILQILADAPAFGTDIVGVDQAKDMIALWHCGLAPLTMADPKFQAHGGLHSNRGVPLVMDFPLKPGEVTFARVSQATGDLRLVLGKGEMLAVPKPFSGTSGTLKVDFSAQTFLDTLMFEGLEHHISLVYGNFLSSLKEFANLAQIPVLSIPKEVS
jgi:L-fucose isomerase-like protein